MTNTVKTVARDRVGRALVAIGLLATGTVAAATAYREASVVTAATSTSKDIVAIRPARYVDTRVGENTVDGEFAGIGRVAGGTEFAVTIAGRPRIGKNADAVVMNVTAVRPDGPGHVTVYPCGTTRPTVSNINYQGGDVAPNAVLSKVGVDGQVCFFSVTNTDLIVDVSAYVPAGGSPMTIDPVRNVDTRSATFGDADNPGRLTGGREYAFTIAGKSGVPADASAAAMNITAVRPDGPGFVTVYPCGSARPTASNINYDGGDVAPNAVLSALGDDGRVCVYSLVDTDLLIDVAGYVPDGAVPIPLVPARFVDTRAGQTTIDGENMGVGRLVGGREYAVTISGRYEVEVGATAAMMNITAVRPDGPGHITVYPCGTARPNVSSINYDGGDVAPNAVFSKLGTNGQICIYSVSDTDLVVDVNAYTPEPSDDPSTTGPTTPTTPDRPTTTTYRDTTTTTKPTDPTDPPAECTIDGQVVKSQLSGASCQALVDLYNYTDGPNWTNNAKWNTRTDPCTWAELTCENGEVDYINLTDNNLTGQIPESIGNLVYIDILTLDVNNLSGPVPASITNFRNPWIVRLRGNGCLTADPVTARWLRSEDSLWDDGCTDDPTTTALVTTNPTR